MSLRSWTYVLVVFLALVPWSLILSIHQGFNFSATYVVLGCLGVVLAGYSLKLFLIYRGQIAKTYFTVIIILSTLLTILGFINIIEYLHH